MTKSEQHQPIARATFAALLLCNRPVLRPEVLARLRAAVEQPRTERLPYAPGDAIEAEGTPHSDEWMRRLGARDIVAEEAFGEAK